MDGQLGDGRVRRLANDVDSDESIMSRVQGVAFDGGAKCDIEVPHGNLNQQKYITILEDKLLPFARGAFH